MLAAMKKIPHCLFVLSLASQASAAIVLSNNFDSVTPGGYTSGTSFGSALLGNATGTDTNTVTAGIGVNGTAGVTSNNLGIRSSSLVDTTVGLTFDFFFNYGSTSTDRGVIAAGVATSSGADGASTYNGSRTDSFQIGLTRLDSSGLVELAAIGDFNTSTGKDNSAALAGGSGDIISTTSMVEGNWYQMKFDLVFNQDLGTPTSSTFTVSSLSVQDWGVSGVDAGSIVLSIDSRTVNGNLLPLLVGSDFNTNSSGYAYITGNKQRGGNVLDNISVSTISAVPEPSIYALFIGLGAIGVVGLRRRSRRSKSE